MIDIRFNNLLDLPQPKSDQKYICNVDGWEYVECFSGYGDVVGPMRNKWIYSSIINLIWLNKGISEEHILKYALSANENKLKPKLSDKEIERMVRTLYIRNLEEELEPKKSMRKVIFNNSLNLSGKERQLLALEANIKMKKNKKLFDLYRIIENWDFDNHGKISQRAIIALDAGIGKKAVEKYYRELRDFIDYQNNHYRHSLNNLDAA